MKISFKILEMAFLNTCYGLAVCDLIELNDKDFEDVVNYLNPIVMIDKDKNKDNTYFYYGNQATIMDLATIQYLETIKISDRFLFRDAIVLKNNNVQEGTIRTFNKRKFKTIISKFEELTK